MEQYQTELKILKDIKKSKKDQFTQLIDYGNTYSSYSQGKLSQGGKFIVMKKLGISLYSILKGNHLNFRKIDILKAGI